MPHTARLTGDLEQLDREGWFLCQSDRQSRSTWHFFRTKYLRSICGGAASYQRSIGVVEFTPQMSSVALLRAGFCGRCDRVRRREEGR